MKTRKSTKAPAFVRRAERALRRAAHNVKTQNRSLGVPVIVWQDGKVVEKPA
jgi:glutaredoxin-related protein